MNSWNDVCNKDDSQANPRRIPRAKLEPRSIRRAQILHEPLVGASPPLVATIPGGGVQVSMLTMITVGRATTSG